MGEVSSFGKLFEYLMILSQQSAFTLIIDEFQDFFEVAPSAYSVQSGNVTNIGGYWDRKGENEIDLSVVNEFDKQTQIIEVKRKAENM